MDGSITTSKPGATRLGVTLTLVATQAGHLCLVREATIWALALRFHDGRLLRGVTVHFVSLPLGTVDVFSCYHPLRSAWLVVRLMNSRRMARVIGSQRSALLLMDVFVLYGSVETGDASGGPLDPDRDNGPPDYCTSP